MSSSSSSSPPQTAEQWLAAAKALHRQGRLAEAEQHYLRAVRLNERLVGALRGLGRLNLQTGHPGRAAECFQRAVFLEPTVADDRFRFGMALEAVGNHIEAVAQLAAATALDPENADAFAYRGVALSNLHRHGEAIDAFATATRLEPENAATWCNLGNVLAEAGNTDRALAAFDEAIERDPTTAMAWHGRGNVLNALGRFEAARESYERAVALVPQAMMCQRALAACAPFTEGDARLAALESWARRDAELNDDNRCHLHFALAKAYADLGHAQRSFEHLSIANACKRKLIGYDEKTVLQSMADITATMNADFIAEGGGFATELPVFIVGMPRSGSTLVEQIIASHPAAFGAGEIKTLQQLVLTCIAGGAADDVVGGDDLREIGRRYVTRVQALAPRAARVTDKMLDNFRHLGLIARAMPGARIVHVRRDPLDTCFSCYATLFSGDVGFSYDLGELGRYYKAYDALMAHWRAVLPPGMLHEVRYETLIDDLEGEAKTLIAFLGLDWDEACLAFHRTRRPIATASVQQVRQPLYRSSVGRAGPYAPWLEPLRAALA